MARNIYPAHPEELRRPLTKAEVREILEARGKKFANDKRKVMHFVERTLLTLEEAQRRYQSLEALNLDLKAQIAAQTGYSGSVDPEYALAFVDPAVLAKKGSLAAQQLAEAAEEKSRRLEAARAQIRDRLLDVVEGDYPPEIQNLATELIAVLDQA